MLKYTCLRLLSQTNQPPIELCFYVLCAIIIFLPPLLPTVSSFFAIPQHECFSCVPVSWYNILTYIKLSSFYLITTPTWGEQYLHGWVMPVKQDIPNTYKNQIFAVQVKTK